MQKRLEVGALFRQRFLYPKFPGILEPYEIRKLSPEAVHARFIQAYAASLGNLSVARFYCGWKLKDFEAELAKYPEFADAIREESIEIADRATFVLQEGLGVLNCDQDGPPKTTAALTALAKAVEVLRERGEVEASARDREIEGGRAARTGRKVVVEGLARPGSVVEPPDPLAPRA